MTRNYCDRCTDEIVGTLYIVQVSPLVVHPMAQHVVPIVAEICEGCKTFLLEQFFPVSKGSTAVQSNTKVGDTL